MQRSIVVVDDFLDNVDEVRKAALALDYPLKHDRAYHGRNSSRRLLIEGLDQAVSALVGEHLRPIEPLHSYGNFRLTLDGDEGLADIHVDQSHWSGILYLSKPEDCQGGTDFFRHKKTNSDRIPMDLEGVKKAGFDSFEAMHRKLIMEDGKARDRWDHVMRVPMVYNRLVLLRPWLFHTSAPGFGDSIENGRLVYLLFFRPAGR